MQNTRRQEVQRSWAQARVFNWFLDNYKRILYFFLLLLNGESVYEHL